MNCGICQTTNQPNSKWCIECGTSLSQKQGKKSWKNIPPPFELQRQLYADGIISQKEFIEMVKKEWDKPLNNTPLLRFAGNITKQELDIFKIKWEEKIRNNPHAIPIIENNDHSMQFVRHTNLKFENMLQQFRNGEITIDQLIPHIPPSFLGITDYKAWNIRVKTNILLRRLEQDYPWLVDTPTKPLIQPKHFVDMITSQFLIPANHKTTIVEKKRTQSNLIAKLREYGIK